MLSVVFERSLRALADLPVRLLPDWARGRSRVAAPLARHAHVEPLAPARLMRLASAMVGHGGFGTTMSALAAGAPQVVVPLFASDQEINATRIAQVGAGFTWMVGRTRRRAWRTP